MAVIALAPDPLVFPYFAVAARFDLTGSRAGCFKEDVGSGVGLTSFGFPECISRPDGRADDYQRNGRCIKHLEELTGLKGP
jgi:hypothetical protein